MLVELFVSNPVMNRFVLCQSADPRRVPRDYGPWRHMRAVDLPDTSDAVKVVLAQGYFVHEVESDGAMRGLPSNSIIYSDARPWKAGHEAVEP